MNEPLSYRFLHDGAGTAPRTSCARVYLTVAGKCDRKYVGVHSVVDDTDFGEPIRHGRDPTLYAISGR